MKILRKFTNQELCLSLFTGILAFIFAKTTENPAPFSLFIFQILMALLMTIIFAVSLGELTFRYFKKK
jgi:hypothetical protein